MWYTLQQGEPWSGIVKNRRKNGDHYWVRANAVPMVRRGQVTGYMSIRTRATGRDRRRGAALPGAERRAL
jgi:aerotaxis receptor